MTEENNTIQVTEKKPKIELVSGGVVSAIVPRNLDEAWRYSQAIVSAGMVPDSLRGANNEQTTAKVMMIINKGMEVGLPPQSALANIMIVNNRPSIWGDGAIALVQASGKLDWIAETIEGEPKSDNWTAICRIKRYDNEQIIERKFTYKQAKDANLIKRVWLTYPERMLQMRARAFAIRDGFADVLSGLSIAEEVRDIPEKKEEVDSSFLDVEPESNDTESAGNE